MPLIAKQHGGGGGFHPAPAGTHIARCVRLIDLGTQHTTFDGQAKTVPQIRLTWELPLETRVFGDGKEPEPYLVSQEYTNSLGDRAKLRQHLESWRGREFTADELAGFDLKAILGKPCMLSIVHKKGQTGNTYAAISGVTALPKGTTPPKQVTETQCYDISEGKCDKFFALPDWLREKISKCVEWTEPAKNETQAQPEPEQLTEEDDVPF